MRKKYFLYLFITFFFFSCSTEFKPSGDVPDLESTIDEIFVDSIGSENANIKLEFTNDSCKSISASYGDKNDIFYQIIWVNEEICKTKICLDKYILPKFNDFHKISKNKDNFDFYAENDSIYSVSWIEQEYIFYMTCKKDKIELAVSNSYFLNFK